MPSGSGRQRPRVDREGIVHRLRHVAQPANPFDAVDRGASKHHEPPAQAAHGPSKRHGREYPPRRQRPARLHLAPLESREVEYPHVIGHLYLRFRKEDAVRLHRHAYRGIGAADGEHQEPQGGARVQHPRPGTERHALNRRSALWEGSLDALPHLVLHVERPQISKRDRDPRSTSMNDHRGRRRLVGCYVPGAGDARHCLARRGEREGGREGGRESEGERREKASERGKGEAGGRRTSHPALGLSEVEEFPERKPVEVLPAERVGFRVGCRQHRQPSSHRHRVRRPVLRPHAGIDVVRPGIPKHRRGPGSSETLSAVHPQLDTRQPHRVEGARLGHG
eukprot:1888356-Rhodomonas_salina.4